METPSASTRKYLPDTTPHLYGSQHNDPPDFPGSSHAGSISISFYPHSNSADASCYLICFLGNHTQSTAYRLPINPVFSRNRHNPCPNFVRYDHGCRMIQDKSADEGEEIFSLGQNSFADDFMKIRINIGIPVFLFSQSVLPLLSATDIPLHTSFPPMIITAVSANSVT